MAGRADLWCTCKNIIQMALLAGYLKMRAGQWERGLRMIELGTLPTGGAVAFPTTLTELARMGVIFCMAGKTFLRRTRESILHMALLAGHFEMHTG